MCDPFLPACDSAGRRTFDVIIVRSLRVFRLNNVIDGLFDNLRQEIQDRNPFVNCGTSMIDRLQNNGKEMKDKKVDDQLLLTW